MDAPVGKGLFEDGPCHEFGGSRRYRGFNEYQAVGLYLLADGAHGIFEGGHIGFAALHIPQLLLGKVALHIHHHAVGILQAVAVVGGHQGLVIQHAPFDQYIHLRVFGLYRRFAPVDQRYLPK